MNLEQLCRDIKANYNRLKDKTAAFRFLRYQFELLAWKKQKLKLGAIVFEIKEFTVAGITLFEEADIRYIRQDTSEDDAMKFENRLKALAWQWDFKNIGALIIVSSLGFLIIYAHLYVWYCENLPSLAFRDPNADEMIYFAFESTLVFRNTEFFKSLILLNYWLVNTIVSFCINYGMLF
jgi:hypothetical protein